MTSPSLPFRFFKSALAAGATLLFLVLIFAGTLRASENPFTLPVPLSSASYTDGEYAPLINPVFSDTSDSTALSYRYMRLNDTDRGNHLVLLNTLGFSFSYAWLENLYSAEKEAADPARTKYFNISRGFFFNNTFGFGGGYSFTSSPYEAYDHYRSWNFGLLLRPVSFLSLGYTLRDINHPDLNGEPLKRTDTYSLSVRPFDHYLTLSADAVRTEGKPIKEADYYYSAQLYLPRDMSLFASTKSGKYYSFGIRLPFDFGKTRSTTAVVDYFGMTKGGNHPGSSQFGLTLTGEVFQSTIILPKNILKIKIANEISEIETQSLMGRNILCYQDILFSISYAGQDDSVRGIILLIDSSNLGFSQVQEIRQELLNFRRTGKKVHAILLSSGNKEYYLASAADRIYFNPSESFWITGLSAQVYFFKDVMDKVGVKLESVRKGKFKSFNESFTRRHMSEEFKENMITLLKDLNDQFLGAISDSRKIPRARVEELLSKGFMRPGEALRAGFIDRLDYPESSEKSILKEQGFNAAVIPLKDYVEQNRKVYQWGPFPSIAVIHVNGSIIRGKTRDSGELTPDNIGDETYRALLLKVFSDRSIKAVVIRVNSGGGSATASDLMWKYLLIYKKMYPKPVVFSFGNVAASGGYYIASTGDRIFASEGTITGSIGVISGKISLKRLYEKLGINKDVIKMSEFADLFSESRDLTPRERELLQKGVDYAYERFTGVVMKGRSLSKSDIPRVAEGRVFTGKQARDKGLVDTLAGLLPAVEYARQLARIRGECRLVTLPQKKLPFLMELFSNGNGERSIIYPFRAILKNYEWVYYKDEKFLYLYPYKVEIR